MPIDCNCTVVYEPVEIHFKPLQATGEASTEDWYISDNIIDWDLKSEIEEGKRNVLKCGGRIKNTMQDKDTLTGGTLKITLCCEDPEIAYIMAGSVGMIHYDHSSPPCAVGYTVPTPDEQETAVDYEVRLYLKVIEGSNVTGYKELHFYECKPTFFDEGGGQEEYPKIEASIKCLDNPNYGAVPYPFMRWVNVPTIPTS